MAEYIMAQMLEQINYMATAKYTSPDHFPYQLRLQESKNMIEVRFCDPCIPQA